MRFDKVLVVIDDLRNADHVLRKVASLPRGDRSTTHVIRVVYEELADLKHASLADLDDLKTLIMQAEESQLEDVVIDHRDRLPKLESATIWNKRVADAALGVAEDIDADLIVKPSHVPERAELLSSPEDWNLLRGAHCPVLLVNPRQWTPRPTILAAIDVLDDAHEPINHRILAIAHALTSALDGHLHAVSTYPHLAPWIPQSGAGLRHAEVARLLDADIHGRVELLSKNANLPLEQIHVREGRADRVVCATVEACDAQVLVLGTFGRSGIRAAVLGNTSERVLYQLRSDALIVPQPIT